jgi:N-acetylmuramoyl-L-alanine amidase
VLVGAYMPAILFETAFLSNDSEERLLRDEAFLDRVVKGLYDGIERYKEWYETGEAYRGF